MDLYSSGNFHNATKLQYSNFDKFSTSVESISKLVSFLNDHFLKFSLELFFSFLWWVRKWISSYHRLYIHLRACKISKLPLHSIHWPSLLWLEWTIVHSRIFTTIYKHEDHYVYWSGQTLSCYLSTLRNSQEVNLFRGPCDVWWSVGGGRSGITL